MDGEGFRLPCTHNGRYRMITIVCPALLQNPVALQGFASGITDLGGLTKGFGEEVSVATAWSHFLAQDLFIVSQGVYWFQIAFRRTLPRQFAIVFPARTPPAVDTRTSPRRLMLQGRWVYLDGRKNGVFTKHSLALCYLFGPVGVLSHLATRTAFSIVKPGIKDIMEVLTV